MEISFHSEVTCHTVPVDTLRTIHKTSLRIQLTCIKQFVALPIPVDGTSSLNQNNRANFYFFRLVGIFSTTLTGIPVIYISFLFIPTANGSLR